MTVAADPTITALHDLLETATSGTALTVHERPVPNLQDTPYWIVDPEGPGLAHRGERLQAARMDGDAKFLDLVVQVTSVGSTARQARWAASQAQDTLVGAVLTVTGRTCEPIVQAFSTGRPEPDSSDPDLFTSMAGYRIRTRPA